MFFEFMQYAFVWHSSQFYAMLAVGVISGLIFSRHYLLLGARRSGQANTYNATSVLG